MTTPAYRYPVPLFFTITGALVLIEWLVVQSPSFVRRPDTLAPAVTVDVVLGLPLLYYWLVGRTGRWSKTATVAVFGAALVLAKWLLPAANQTYVNGIAQVLPLLEAGVLIYLAYHANRLLKTYRSYRQANSDFVSNLQRSLNNVTGSPVLSQLLATEAAVVRYGLFGWAGRIDVADGQRAITSHRHTGQVAVLLIIILVAIVESAAVHLLVARWSAGGAWLLTAISLYGILFIVAETVTTVKRPSFVHGQTLHLRFGMRWRTVIALNNMERIERINEKPIQAPDLLVGPLLVPPNLLLTLREPVIFDGIYGLKKTVTRIAVLVDEPNLQGLQDLTGLILTR